MKWRIPHGHWRRTRRGVRSLLMAAITDQAIVLRRLDYSETSQVLAFLSREHGLQRLIAKGVKRSTSKRFVPGIDLLERGQATFLPKSPGAEGLGTLTEWHQQDAHLGLRQDLHRLYAAQYAAEITAAMTEEADPHPELFDALAAVLAGLAAGGEPVSLIVAYQCSLIRLVGLWPDLTRCVLCGRLAPPGRGAWFSAHQGGLVCRDCARSVPQRRQVRAETLAAVRENRVSGENAAGAFDLLNYAITETIGRVPVLAKFIVSLR